MNMKPQMKRVSAPAARWMVAAALLAPVLGFAASAPFGVPVRLSIKFILNPAGNRSATGTINTDAEVTAQFETGNRIFANFISELRMHDVEILNVSGSATNYYDYTASVADRDAIRTAAQAATSTFQWRSDAVNIYITQSNASAIADFPPDNNIIIMGQGISDTTMAHELGHILYLYHTHETVGSDGGDECTDTLKDNPSWDKDDIATNAFGVVYTSCTAGQKVQVDNTYSNLMSYHHPDSRSVVTSCQWDRESTESYADRNWLLTKKPVYIQNGYSGAQSGSFTAPYATVQGAISAAALANRVMVLKTSSTHTNPTSVINTATDVVTRRGSSTIKEMAPEFNLPTHLENSTNPAVHAAVLRAQQNDMQKDGAAALAALREAEQNATGEEKQALQLEIAQRLRDGKHFEEAGQWYQKVHDAADQPGLKKHALRHVEKMKDEAAQQANAKKSQAEGKEK